MQAPDTAPDQAGLDRRAKFAIAACVVLPVVIGVVVTAGTFRPQPAPPPPVAGHWVYVQSLGTAVHVDGGSKKVDASVPVGSASADSLVVQDQHANYLVDSDKTIEFTRTGVTDDKPSVGVGEPPVPVQAAGRGYLVYRAAGMVVPLGSQQPITSGLKLGAPVMTPSGELWVNRPDTGEICVVETTLQCKVKIPGQGTLTLVDGKPVFVVGSTVHHLTTKDRPTKLGVSLPDNALVGGSSVDGRIPVIDPAGKRLLLIAPGGDAVRVPLAPGNYDRPCAAGDAVAVVDENTGTVTSYDAEGIRRATHVLGSNARTTRGDDGRVYVDSTDGLQSVVMDPDGTLTPVPTSDQIPPVYKEAPTTTTPPPPAPTITPTTTETIPAAPDTVTLTPTATGGPSGGTGGAGGPGNAAAGSSTKPKGPTSTKPLPGAPGPTVDVLSATALGGGKARVRVSVRGGGTAFCHVFFNSVERAAAKCAGETDITATGIPPNQLYDVHVLGVNDKGTGNPGRRVELAM